MNLCRIYPGQVHLNRMPAAHVNKSRRSPQKGDSWSQGFT